MSYVLIIRTIRANYLARVEGFLSGFHQPTLAFKKPLGPTTRCMAANRAPRPSPLGAAGGLRQTVARSLAWKPGEFGQPVAALRSAEVAGLAEWRPPRKVSAHEHRHGKRCDC